MSTFDLLAVAGIAALTFAFIALAARFGGWRELAQRYPGVSPMAVHQTAGAWAWWQPRRRAWWGITSIRLRWFAGYNGCVLWRADDEYLHLRIVPPFSAFHPPISIPWREMEVIDERVIDGKARWFLRVRVAGLPLFLTRRVAAPLLDPKA